MKKSRPKKVVKSNKSISRKNILTKFHFLQFQKWPKIDFWTGKTAKNAISRKKIWFIWFHEFFCLDFFKFSGPLWYVGVHFFSDQTLLTIARAEHLKARNPISFVLVVQRLPKFPLPMYKFWLKSKSWMKNVNPHSYDILVMAGCCCILLF